MSTISTFHPNNLIRYEPLLPRFPTGTQRHRNKLVPKKSNEKKTSSKANPARDIIVGHHLREIPEGPIPSSSVSSLNLRQGSTSILSRRSPSDTWFSFYLFVPPPTTDTRRTVGRQKNKRVWRFSPSHRLVAAGPFARWLRFVGRVQFPWWMTAVTGIEQSETCWVWFVWGQSPSRRRRTQSQPHSSMDVGIPNQDPWPGIDEKGEHKGVHK